MLEGAEDGIDLLEVSVNPRFIRGSGQIAADRVWKKNRGIICLIVSDRSVMVIGLRDKRFSF